VGFSYLSIRYAERIAEAGSERSVGSIGDSYRNALTETIMGLYESEVIRCGPPWRGIEAVEFATLECVDWINHRRLLGRYGDVLPAELDAMCYAATKSAITEGGPN